MSAILAAATAPLSFWYWTQRRIDLQFLWPAIRREAYRRRCELPDDRPASEWLMYAKAAFGMHAFNDPPWRWLGHDEICRRIDRLT